MVDAKNLYNDAMKTVAIIPGAGSGERMGTGRAKQFLELNSRPLLAFTLEKFQECQAVDSIIVVVPRMDMEFCKREIIERYSLSKVKKIVPLQHLITEQQAACHLEAQHRQPGKS